MDGRNKLNFKPENFRTAYNVKIKIVGSKIVQILVTYRKQFGTSRNED